MILLKYKLEFLLITSFTQTRITYRMGEKITTLHLKYPVSWG